MCCLGLGLDLMHLLGWVSIHDTHQHMEALKKKFCSYDFWCVDFWVVTETKILVQGGEIVYKDSEKTRQQRGREEIKI